MDDKRPLNQDPKDDLSNYILDDSDEERDIANDLSFNTEDDQVIDREDFRICTDNPAGFFIKKDGAGSGGFSNVSSNIDGINNVNGVNSGLKEPIVNGINNTNGINTGLKQPIVSGAKAGISKILASEDLEVLSLDDTPKDIKDRSKKFSEKRSINKEKPVTRKQTILLAVLGALLMVAYATFVQSLSYNAKQKQIAQVSNGSWDIRFTDMYPKRKIGDAKELSSPAYSATKASFHISLSKPGDEITYNLTIKNNGTLNAKVSSIYLMPENNDTDNILYHVKDIAVGDYLDVGQSTNMSVTAKYNENAPATNRLVKDVSVIINYVQR